MIMFVPQPDNWRTALQASTLLDPLIRVLRGGTGRDVLIPNEQTKKLRLRGAQRFATGPASAGPGFQSQCRALAVMLATGTLASEEPASPLEVPVAGVGNTRPTGCIRPLKSFGVS